MFSLLISCRGFTSFTKHSGCKTESLNNKKHLPTNYVVLSQNSIVSQHFLRCRSDVEKSYDTTTKRADEKR
jgi:hypothetical protein